MKKRVLAIVPAKGDSARLPGKNRRMLEGEPLFVRAALVARGAGCDKVIVSSSCRVTADIARANSIEVYPEPTPHRDMRQLRDEILREEWEYQHKFDAVMWLLPTYVFRSARDVMDALELVEEGHESIQSAEYLERFRIYLPNSFMAVDKLHDKNRIAHRRPKFKTYIEVSGRKLLDVDTRDDFAEAERLAANYDWGTGRWSDQ